MRHEDGPGRTGLVTAITTVTPVAAIVVVQLVLFPVPVGVWLQGFVMGLLGSLMAIGLGLVYRLNKVLNFAQGDLGTAPAVLAVGMIALSGVNYFVGLATGIVGVVALTLGVEVLVIRRFSKASRIVLTVATIGVSQVLVVLSLAIPRIWGDTPISTAVVNFPFHLTWRLSPITFTSDDLVAVVVSLGTLAAVAAWFKRSDVGVVVRASGDRRNLATMFGISVNRLQTLTWVVAGLLSFLSIFFSATLNGLPLDPTFSLTALVSALAALALGGFDNLPIVGAAAVALGVLEQAIAWDQPTNPDLSLAVIAAVVLASLLVREAFVRNVNRTAASGWSFVESARALPREIRDDSRVRAASPLSALLLVLLFFSLPLWMGPATLIDVSNLVILAMVGCSVVVLTGWLGQVTLAQLSFAAVGGAVGAVALQDWGLDLSLALLVAGAAAGIVCLVVGLPTLRMDGMFAAITTLAFGLAASGYLLNRADFGWIPSGYLVTPRFFGVPLATESAVFEVCLGVAILVLVALHGLRRSRAGRALRALAENERAAAGFGVRGVPTKLWGFALSGFIAGVAGCLLVIVSQQYNESSFAVSNSLSVLAATVVGGLASPMGAVVGAALVEGSTIFLPANWQILPSAFGVLIVLLLFPGGVVGALFRVRDRLLCHVFGHEVPSQPAPLTA